MRFNLERCTATILLVMICYACATPYQGRTNVLGGYSSTKIQDGIYRVTFEGNSDATESRVADFAMLRSAEIALENGFSYFVILDGSTKSRAKEHSSGGVSQTYGTVTGYGDSAKIKSTTIDSGGYTHTSYEPTSVLMIQCYKIKPRAAGTIFDAASVRDSIRAQYKIGQKTTQPTHRL